MSLILATFITQAATATPEGVPSWLWAVLGAIGTFAATQLWPAARGWIDADFKARREAARAGADNREERYLAAQEQVAKALQGVAESSKETAAAITIFANHKAADSFVTQAMQRDIAAIRVQLGMDEPPEPRRRRKPVEAPAGD